MDKNSSSKYLLCSTEVRKGFGISLEWNEGEYVSTLLVTYPIFWFLPFGTKEAYDYIKLLFVYKNLWLYFNRNLGILSVFLNGFIKCSVITQQIYCKIFTDPTTQPLQTCCNIEKWLVNKSFPSKTMFYGDSVKFFAFLQISSLCFAK